MTKFMRLSGVEGAWGLRRRGRATLTAVLLAVVVLVASCGPAAGAGPQAWIDAPLHDSVHPVAPMEVMLHGADPGGVALIELSINGEVLSRRPPDDTAAALVTHRIPWDPPAPGDYLLVARAQNHAGAWSAQTSHHVTLIDSLPVVIATLPPTATPPITPSPTPTPTCADKATFIADVTIPDNTVVSPGAAFTKTWRLRNDGTCPWDKAYALVFVGGDPMSNPTPVAIPNIVAPGGTIDLSLPLAAPTSAGTHRGDYQIRNPQGVLFGVGAAGQTPFYVQILVGRPTSPPPPPTAPAPDTQAPSVSVSHSPAGSSVPTSATITFTAIASDNVGVARIDIWVTPPGGWPTKVKTCNNTTSCSYTGGPYSQGNLTYFALAADAAGNETNSGGTTILIYVVISGVPDAGATARRHPPEVFV